MVLISIMLWTIVLFSYIVKCSQAHARALNWTISFLCAVTVVSFTYSIALFSGLHFTIYQIADILIPLVLLLLQWQKLPNIFKADHGQGITISGFMLVVVLLCIVGFTWLFFSYAQRWGHWDAWAIWSLHAKFLIHEDTFTNLFTNNIGWTHPDYPLMLPSIIAVVWKSFDTLSPFVPLLVSYIISIALIILILSSYLEKRLFVHGIIILAVLTCTTTLYTFGAMQYADTLLALFMVIPFVILEHNSEEHSYRGLFLVGFFTATCGWIKNEGMMFFVIFSLYFILKNIRNIKHIMWFMLGAILPLVMVFYFKLNYAPVNDLVSHQRGDLFQKLTDMSRYVFILNYFGNYIFFKTTIVFVILLIGFIFCRYHQTFAFRVIFTMMIVYFFVYVVTPLDVDWHLNTSFDRLFHQVTPLLLYTVFIRVKGRNNI